LRARTGLVLAALITLVAACGGGAGPATSKHPEGLGDVARRTAVLPVQAYIMTRAQNDVVNRAVVRITDACMSRQGFPTGLAAAFKPPAGGHVDDFLDRRYASVYDKPTALRYGLHLPTMVDTPTMPPEDPRFTPEVAKALFGDIRDNPPAEEVNVAAGRTAYGGCMGQAEAQLAKGTRYTVALGEGYAQPARLLSLDTTDNEDPRVLAAQARWSACMAESGYDIDNTVSDDDPIPGIDLNSPKPSAAEIKLALVEVACQDKTHVVQTWFEVESAYQRAKIDEQAEVFAQIRRENQLVVERAAALVGEPVPAGTS